MHWQIQRIAWDQTIHHIQRTCFIHLDSSRRKRIYHYNGWVPINWLDATNVFLLFSFAARYRWQVSWTVTPFYWHRSVFIIMIIVGRDLGFKHTIISYSVFFLNAARNWKWICDAQNSSYRINRKLLPRTCHTHAHWYSLWHPAIGRYISINRCKFSCRRQININ